MIEKILLTILVICILTILFCFYMLYRNSRTYNTRVWFINNDYEKYQKLPTYDEMLYSFKPLTVEYWTNYIEKTNKKYNHTYQR